MPVAVIVHFLRINNVVPAQLRRPDDKRGDKMNRVNGSLRAILAAALILAIQLVVVLPVSAEPADPKLKNDRCLRCHGREGFSREDVYGRDRDLFVNGDHFADSSHGEQD